MELPRNRLPESKGEYEMTRTITANVESRKTVNELAVIDWDDDKYGEPTEENILKALNDDKVFSCEVIDTDDSVEEYLSVSNIEEDED
jgi:hypothetical protein